ncbi:MAG: hypothetical protein H6674_10995 [Dehalococcoidia bacterium]|nr:hypothetical protein [Dehalococcoidia bacterium]
MEEVLEQNHHDVGRPVLKLADPDLDVNPVSCLERALAALRDDVVVMSGSHATPHPVDLLDVETRIGVRVGEIARAATQHVLASLMPRAGTITVDGIAYQRLNQVTVGRYGTMFGEVEVARPLFREVGVRNGRTVDVIAARGGIRDGFTPRAETGIALAVQAMPAREAHGVCAALGVLPYSRSTFQRVPERVGERWHAVADEVRPTLSWSEDALERAVAIAVEVDRVATPMAEPRELTPTDTARGVRRPVNVAWRMSFYGDLVLLDADGAVVDTLRHAQVADGGHGAVVASMRAELDAAVKRVPQLRIATLANGAQEMQGMLEEITEGREVTARLVDLWHLLRYVREAGNALGVDVEHLVSGIFTYRHGIDDLEAWVEEQVRDLRDKAPRALLDAHRYLENKRHLIDYYSARETGVPIGSGHVEATCKTIVSVRFKRAGARWSRDGAQHLLALRALAQSGDRWRPTMTGMYEREAHDVSWAA